MSDQTLDCAARLRSLMEAHTLTRRAVANLLGVSVYTVTSWLADSHAHKHRTMPGPMLRLLELELRLCPRDLESALAVETLSLNDFFTDCLKKA